MEKKIGYQGKNYDPEYHLKKKLNIQGSNNNTIQKAPEQLFQQPQNASSIGINPNYKGRPENYNPNFKKPSPDNNQSMSVQPNQSKPGENLLASPSPVGLPNAVVTNPGYKGRPENFDPNFKKKIHPNSEMNTIVLPETSGLSNDRNPSYKGRPENYDPNFKKSVVDTGKVNSLDPFQPNNQFKIGENSLGLGSNLFSNTIQASQPSNTSGNHSFLAGISNIGLSGNFITNAPPDNSQRSNIFSQPSNSSGFIQPGTAFQPQNQAQILSNTCNQNLPFSNPGNFGPPVLANNLLNNNSNQERSMSGKKILDSFESFYMEVFNRPFVLEELMIEFFGKNS